MNPLVSVITTVYNCEKYLEESIQSILNQTFTDFEYILVNDGSTDMTSEIIKKFALKDKRIKVIEVNSNIGRVSSLNKALEKSTGKYIALQDADDVSLTERLSAQVSFLNENPEYALVGSDITVTDEEGNFLSDPIRPETDDEIRFSLLFRCTLANPSIMYRRKILEEHKINYEEKFLHAEDFRFISLISSYGKVFNLRQKLVKYRKHDWNNSSVNYNILNEASDKISAGNLSGLGFQISEEQIRRIRNLISSRGINKNYLLQDMKLILSIIKKFRAVNNSGRNNEIIKLLRRMKYWLGKKDIVSKPGHMSLQIYILTYYYNQTIFTK